VTAVVDAVRTFDAVILPRGWRAATLENILGSNGIFVDGDWVESKDQDPEGDVRLIQLADVGDCEYRDRSERFLTSQKAQELSCTFLEPGDLLVARMPDPLGRACIFPGDKRRAVTVVDVAVVRPSNPDVNTRWLMYCVNAPQFRRVVASLQSGSTRQRISRKNLAKICFPLPSRGIQDLIVEEIEKQFSRLDEAVANLKRVKANLKRYKATVLKAAVEGRLVATEAELARREGRSFETGEQLLQRILAARRSQWKGKGKYRQLAAPNTVGLLELPEGWVWTVSDAIFEFVTSGSRGWAKYYSDSGAIFLRVGNLDHGTIDLDLSEIQHVVAPANPEADRSRVKRGDLLISITAELGMVAVAPESLGEAYINQHVAMGRSTDLIDKNYIGWYFACEHAGKKQLESLRRGATKAGLGLDDIRSVYIALPPLAEQHRIVAEVDRRLSLIREVEGQVDVNFIRLERLRQSILKRAFSGQIVRVGHLPVSAEVGVLSESA
jgi:type I restriction enzyme S subunit